MSQLPRGWCSAELGMLIERIEAGLNVKCEERPPQVGERGLVKISAVTWGQFNEDQSKTLPLDSTVTESTRIRPGDLLFSRANTIELVGATVVVGSVTKNLYLSDKVLRLVVPEASKRWINFAMKTAETRKAIQDASSGNQLSMRNVSQEKLRQISIPLAPLPEQKRIADKLDTVLARVDACRDRLDRIPALLKRFRQSILAAATSGRLTEDWRATRRPDEAQQNPGATTPDSGADAPTSRLPTCWQEMQLGQLIHEMRNGLSPKPTEQPPGAKILRISSVRPRKVDFNDHRYLEIDQATQKQYSLEKDDLLFTRYNGSLEFLGVCAHVPSPQPDYVYPDKLIRVRANTQKVAPKFIELAFGSQSVREQVEEFVKSSAGQKGISGGDLKTTRIPVPPLEEQHEIVCRVETLFAFADRLEARLATARKQASQLTPALLAKAFRGELVPQDPNDEPATELLKHLATQRDNAPKPKRGRKTSA